jgi:hypothetical protein
MIVSWEQLYKKLFLLAIFVAEILNILVATQKI